MTVTGRYFSILNSVSISNSYSCSESDEEDSEDDDDDGDDDRRLLRFLLPPLFPDALSLFSTARVTVTRAFFMTRDAYSASGYLRKHISFTLKIASPTSSSVLPKIDFGSILFTSPM